MTSILKFQHTPKEFPSAREKPQMVKALALVVALNKGQPAVDLVRSMRLVDRSLRILPTEQGLCIPLSRPIDESESARLFAALGPISIEEREFGMMVERPRTLVEALKGDLPPHLLAVVPRSFDIIGRIAIVELSDELARFGDLIGEAVLKTCPVVRTVMAKAGIFSSEYRTRELRLIAGEDNTATRYREHGCIFELDVRTVFFSPRLGHERLRVASQVEPGETVVDMFAGVGPYSILIAKKQPRSSVYAVDANPSAFKFLVSNILANKALGSVRPMMGDVREVVRSSLSRTADRVIMNLPGSALYFVGDACLSLKERGGIIHFYSFESAENPREVASMKLKEQVEASGRELNSVMTVRTVKEIAPYRVQVAVDALVK